MIKGFRISTVLFFEQRSHVHFVQSLFSIRRKLAHDTVGQVDWAEADVDICLHYATLTRPVTHTAGYSSLGMNTKLHNFTALPTSYSIAEMVHRTRQSSS
jgi:hypothetical protein